MMTFRLCPTVRRAKPRALVVFPPPVPV
jgi:hypothetical protein